MPVNKPYLPWWPWQSSFRDERGAVRFRRWMLLPHNQFFNVYLHHVTADDPADAMHDHEYCLCAFTLFGRAVEQFLAPNTPGTSKKPYMVFTRELKRARFYLATFIHRFIDVDDLWTVVVHGPRYRKYQFYEEY